MNPELSDREILLYLHSKIAITAKRLGNIFNEYPSLEVAIKDNFKLTPQIPGVNNISYDKLNDELYQCNTFLAEQDIYYITILDELYPNFMKEISQPPVVIYFQGNINLLLSNDNSLLTVVGSRNPSQYIHRYMNEILSIVCSSGVSVVSGMAIGIDALAHSISLESDSPTIGVLGSGLDDTSFYPSHNIKLRDRIIQQRGLIVSEFAPGTKATQYTFPLRNRILAAISPVTLVMQAGLKSGSLVTAQFALKANKKLLSPLVPMFEDVYAGNIEILRLGADVVTSAEDILKYYPTKNFPTDKKSNQPSPVNEIEKTIYSTLTLIPQSIDIIAKTTSLSISIIMKTLSVLEMKGYVKNHGSNLWSK